MMQFFINKERFIASIQDVLKAVAVRTTIPILTGIKIDADENGVTLTGSDSDISIRSFIPKVEDNQELVEVVKPGSIVLQARFFSEVVKKMPGPIVELRVEDQYKTVISSGNAEFVIHGLDPEEYPRLPLLEDDVRLSIRTDLLKTFIKQTVFAVSTSETRPILTGVHWVIKNQELLGVATDSHRLTQKKILLEPETEELEKDIVIPGKSLNELIKVVDDRTDEFVQIAITENQILFQAKNLLFYSRLLEGKYPETSRLIPTDWKTTVTLDAKEFLQAVDRASLLAREGKNNVIKFSTLTGDSVEISSYTPEIGTVQEKINATIKGEEIKISFSAKYMMDALRAIDGTEVTIYFTGPLRPFIIKTDHDESILQLLLPVRTY